MAAENTRSLLDEFNTNVLEAIGEVKELNQLKELLKNDHILDGYKLQTEEDKIWFQHERELHNTDVNKELKEAELEIRKLEIEQRREQFILENEYKKEELKLRETIHLDEELNAQQEHAIELDNIELKKRELELKEREIELNCKQEKKRNGIKIGFGIGGAFLTWLAMCINNEGILNDTAKKFTQAWISNWPGKA